MLESPVRPKQPQLHPKKRFPFKKQHKLVTLLLLCSLGWFALRSCQARFFKSGQQTQTSSLVSLRSLTPTARQSQLIALINQPERGLSPQQQRDRHRAHYLLAADLIQQGKGKQALDYLQDLSQNYPLLRPQILFKIAQAYRQDHQPQQAEKTLNYLIKNYPNSPLSANALILLAKKQPLSAQLISQFPYHPLTQNIARQRLQQNPNQYQLLLLLTRFSRAQDLNPIRDRLVLKYAARLTADDWQAIADGYWRDEEHRKAADAYIFAPSIPRNLYRAARGFHRNGNLDSAQSAYQRLLQEYHDSQEAGQALIHLASISSGDEAVVYLEKAIAKFPEVAPEAYRSKAIVHERFGKYDAANDARQKLLNQYSNSNSAGEYRWQKAQDLAAQGNKRDAWEWMQPVVKSNQEYDFAAQALYTTGKWAMAINQPEAAKTTFQQIIKLYPQSYWAWRATVMLRWEVGDFNQLRSLAPTLDLTKTYEPLPMGSAALQELYFLAQYDDAWLLLQSEIEHPQQTSVNEQFAEGVLLLELGQYSQGMKQIWDLTKRETPQELEQWKALRQTKTYWQSLFPFPYETQILQNTQQDKINPLLVISVMRKESTFNPTIDSAVGAVGLMQVVPPTAQWAAAQIGIANYSLTNPDDNIKIGTWYLKHNHQRYQDDSLLAVASYNAGTSNVNSWLQQYNIKDRDRFVEQIPFPETKDYVEGVFGNYWNYLRLYNPEIRRKVADLHQETKQPAKPSK
ncbi:lytic murein transglycosylase [Pleurocapsa sp. CCALA 161]|uniref:lytic transglycosylase domain-containing protein n=1 Tax=Pleurocapsa sp. CCALA 161 TaxID=2107688 RepID=UPI000D0662EC|nr:transglycosylase SLT domain-containing protein [Pleurocapsa sp. CCALA 161]PSB12014.1 lytic murein transglycosylase [Pleurocapsa sp. CCALA 161]